MSVVPKHYAELYRARSGCGDWLHTTLETLTLRHGRFDLVHFEAICTSNGVDLSGRDRTRHGWQGRLRMDGRNMLAAIVRRTRLLKLPNGGQGSAPATWKPRRP
jgi:hypothetical protein